MSVAAADVQSRSSGRTLYWLVLATVALAPLPFGSNRPWSWSLLATVVGVLLLAWSVSNLRSARGMAIAPRRVLLPASLFLGVCLFALLQAVPVLPSTLAHPMWALDPLTDSGSGVFAISLSPRDTLTALMRLVSYGAVFWLVLQESRGSSRADEAIGVIAVVTGIYSAYGVIVFLSGSGAILWFEKWAYLRSVTSTFVNRNSFATFAGLGLLCASAYLFRALIRSDLDQSSLRRLLGDLLGRMTPMMMGSIVAIPVNLAALMLTQSRAGIVFSAVAVVVFFVGLSFRLKARRRLAIAFIVLTAVAMTYYLLIAGSGFLERLNELVGSDLERNARLIVYEATIAEIRQHPWLGVGYGTYEDFFRLIRTPEMPLGRAFRAHSTYLENVIELGIPAATALFASIALLAARAFRGLRRRRSVFVYCWLAVSATVLVGSHALVDFSLQMPAIAVTYAAILAVGCSQSWSGTVDTSR